MSCKQDKPVYVGTYQTYMDAECAMYYRRRNSRNWDISFKTVKLANGKTELYQYPNHIICEYGDTLYDDDEDDD